MTRIARSRPSALKTAITQDAAPRPAASASAWDLPSSIWLLVTVAWVVAARAVATAAPTYRAMLETPDASPTWFAGTEAVAAADAGPLDSPMPTAIAMRGSRKAAYFQDESVRPIAAKPMAVSAKPAPIVCRPPNLPAILGTNGAITTSPTVAGSVARPACSAEKSSVAGSWK